MKQAITFITAILLTATLWVQPVSAQEQEEQDTDRDQRSPMEQLDLTDAQREQMRTLRFGLEKDMARLRADQEVAEIELREVLDRTNPDVAAAAAAAGKVNEARSAIFQREIAFQVATKNVLTAEQQEQLQKSMRDRMGRMRQNMERRGPGRRPGRPGQPMRPRFSPRR
jgi:Spy/CpxP family protein refolding chaperone